MSGNYSFGRRIAYLRQLHGWTQEALAFESNISKNYLSDLESGRRNPTLATLSKLAIAFEIDLATLLKGVDIKSPTPKIGNK
ncbi:MAG TPA: transcriptional regulator [Firmicutes bacterium]|nr:transcriptional regulator [Bacillota bacterium]